MSYPWKLVLLLFCCAMINYGDRAAITTVFPLFRADLGMSNVGMAEVGSLFLWSYALGSPFAGRLADRFSRSRIIVVSMAAWSLITLATGLAQSVNQILLTRVLLGLAECLYLPAAIALIADHHGSETRAKAIGFHNAGLSVGLVAAGWTSGYLGGLIGWRAPFIVLGAAGLALATSAHYILRDGPAHKVESVALPPARRKDIAVLLSIPSFTVILAQAALFAISSNTFINWLPLYFKETYNLGLATAAFSGTFLLQFPAMFGASIGGVVSDRTARAGRHRRMRTQALFYLAATPLLTLFAMRPSYWVIAAAIFVFGLLVAIGAANEHPMLCDLLAPRMRSSAIGIMNATNCLSGGIAVLVSGILTGSYGLGMVLGANSIAILLSAAILLVGYRFFFKRDLGEG